MLLALLVAATLNAAPGNTWILATADTRVVVEASTDSLIIRRVEGIADGHNWAGDSMPVPLMSRVWVGGKEHPVQWKFSGGSQSADATTVAITFACDTPAMTLVSNWRARPGRGPVEHWLTLRNDTSQPLTISHQDSLTLSGLQPDTPADLCWIKRGGSNASTEGGTFIQPFSPQTDLNLVNNCDDGASPVPWLAVQSNTNSGLYVGWEFSGLGRIEARAAQVPGQLNMAIGLNRDFKTDINPGEVFLVPAAFVGCYQGDLDEGSYALHQWILNYLRPKLPTDTPDPVLAYNLYLDAGGAEATEVDVLRSARFCREIGFEAFMPDAMWFPACGDWRWDPARFPKGISPIEQYVHESGMRLALWCAWTNGGLSEHPEALSVRGAAGHPDWFDSDFPADWKPGPFYGGRVCLACPEARAWELKKTQWLVSNHKLDYLKHDCGPIITSCNKTSHRHSYGVDASYWATVGYYEIQEKLRETFPALMLENCSGGGHIKDFGVIQRTHYTVTTDTLSNLPDRQSIYDSTYAMPPILLQAYTYERAYKVSGDDPGSYLWRSAMMGAWQIDPTNTRIWTDEEKASAQRDAQIYKEWVRPMLKDVKVHHILPRPDGIQWDGMFYWSPTLKQGTVYLFRPNAIEEQKNIPLKGLDPDRKYWVWCESGTTAPAVRSGDDLLKNGIVASLPHRFTSDLYYLRDAELGQPEGIEEPGPFELQPVQSESDPFRVTSRFSWTPSEHARSVRIMVAGDPEFKVCLAEKTVVGQSAVLTGLPPGERLFWRAEAVSWGGKRQQSGSSAIFATPLISKLHGVTFLSSMTWNKATAGAGNAVRRDTNYLDQKISIAGRVYPVGVWTHAFNDTTPADIVVDITGRKFHTFSAEVGVEDAGGNGSVQFEVLVDGVLKASSPRMTSGKMHPFNVSVANAHGVTLRVLNGGDGYLCDHAAWGLARFLTQDATPLDLSLVHTKSGVQ